MIQRMEKESLVNHSSSNVGMEECESVGCVLNTNYVGYGAAGKALEQAFCSHTGKRFGFAVSSGFHAISLAIRALDLPVSSNIAIPVLTCPSLIHAIESSGHQVKLTDICADNLTLDASRVPGGTGAIIAPHAYGSAVDVEKLCQLGLPWIEDCATSPATTVLGKPAGAWGTISVFSFNSTKYITAGSGGMVLTDDFSLAEKINYLLEIDAPESSAQWIYPIPNRFPGRLSDVNSAIALTQFGRMPVFLQRRKAIADCYTSRLSGIEDFVLPASVEGHSFYRYIIRTRQRSEELVIRLRKNGVDARVAVNPWLDGIVDCECGSDSFQNGLLWKEHMLSLPMHASLTLDQANQVADCLIELVN